jgi:PAS domain S-box-containing protein
MSNERVQLIVDGMPGLISTATAAGVTEFVNQQLLEYLGKTLKALNGWAVFDAVHPEDRPQTMAAWKHSLETGDPYDVQHRLCDANGTYRWCHVRGLPARDAEGRIIRWNILLTDIEDRKQAEEKLPRNETDLMEARRLARELQHERDRLRFPSTRIKRAKPIFFCAGRIFSKTTTPASVLMFRQAAIFTWRAILCMRCGFQQGRKRSSSSKRLEGGLAEWPAYSQRRRQRQARCLMGVKRTACARFVLDLAPRERQRAKLGVRNC